MGQAQSIELVQQSDDEVFEALRVAAHDLKNPLTTIKTLAQILKIGAERGTLASDVERTVRNCAMLLDQVDRLALYTDLLIDVSRAQNGRLRFEPRLGDLREMLRVVAVENARAVAELVTPKEQVIGLFDLARLVQAVGLLIFDAQHVTIKLSVLDQHAHIEFQGELKALAPSSPRIYLARFAIEQHGGRLGEGFQIDLPLRARDTG